MTGFIRFRRASSAPEHTVPAGSNKICFLILKEKYQPTSLFTFQYLHVHLTPTVLLGCVKYPYNLETLAFLSHLSLLESFPKQNT